MLQKRGKSRNAGTVWEEDRSFQLALQDALPWNAKPKAIYSVTVEELPSSTYVVVFENSLPPLRNPFGTVGDYEVTVLQAETVSNTSEPTPISDLQRYATLLLEGKHHGGTNLDGIRPNAIDLGQIQQYPPNASVGYHIYYFGANITGDLTTDLGTLVKTTVIASEITCTRMAYPHAVLSKYLFPPQYTEVTAAFPERFDVDSVTANFDLKTALPIKSYSVVQGVGVRFTLPNRNMPFRWNSRMETNATAYGLVLGCATKYIEYMLNVIHSWDGVLEATWMYRLETVNQASVVVHGHIELNVYRLIQKHYHLDWDNIVKTFNRNFMNKFPFRPVELFDETQAHTWNKCDLGDCFKDQVKVESLSALRHLTDHHIREGVRNQVQHKRHRRDTNQQVSVLPLPHQRTLDASEFSRLNRRTCSRLSDVIGVPDSSNDDPVTVLVATID
ncbi:hypothetical protein CLF_108696 [Clonorchis sinensis]|uniref:Uncharacterized protein n=1 Tax=Clonorchis sinensis TaxID=79923 RepID=G7YRU7_CLOSI|nr:hypothetical protein CLF_108696 [Clonorchis sinensis]